MCISGATLGSVTQATASAAPLLKAVAFSGVDCSDHRLVTFQESWVIVAGPVLGSPVEVGEFR